MFWASLELLINLSQSPNLVNAGIVGVGYTAQCNSSSHLVTAPGAPLRILFHVSFFPSYPLVDIEGLSTPKPLFSHLYSFIDMKACDSKNKLYSNIFSNYILAFTFPPKSIFITNCHLTVSTSPPNTTSSLANEK